MCELWMYARCNRNMGLSWLCDNEIFSSTHEEFHYHTRKVMIIILLLSISWRKWWIISIVYPWWWHALWGGLWKLSYTWVINRIKIIVCYIVYVSFRAKKLSLFESAKNNHVGTIGEYVVARLAAIQKYKWIHGYFFFK